MAETTGGHWVRRSRRIIPAARLYFERRDVWVGVYWNYSPRTDPLDVYDYSELKVYICLVPCVPLRLTWRWHGFEYREGA